MSHRPLVLIAVVSLFACAKAAEPSAASAKLTATSAPSSPRQAAQDPHAGFSQLSVDEVADLLAKHEARAVDANGPETRQQYGTLPGAVLLSNYAAFQTSELPS